MDKYFTQDDIRMMTKHVKRHSTSLSLTEMKMKQNKTWWLSLHAWKSSYNKNNTDDIEQREDVEPLKLSHIASQNAKLHRHSGK